MDEELKAMAEQAGLNVTPWEAGGSQAIDVDGSAQAFTRFAALVAAKCAGMAPVRIRELATRWRSRV